MELTDALKAWAVENLGVAAEASDDEYKAAIQKAIADGTLSAAEYARLAAEEPDAKQEFAEMLATANRPIIEGLEKVSGALGGLAEKVSAPTATELTEDEPNGSEDRMAAMEKRLEELAQKREPSGTRADVANSLMAKAAMGGSPRVKSIAERFSTTRKALICPERIPQRSKHPTPGKQARWLDGTPLYESSELDLAICGAFAKWQFLRDIEGPFAENRMTDLDVSLLTYAMHEMEWTGMVGVPLGSESKIDLRGTEVNGRKLTPPDRKALLDDTTSGGSYAVPRAFDEAIAAAPILFGELAPLVDMQTLARGSVVDGSTWTDPSFAAQTEGTAVSLATTSGLIGNLDTTIFATVAAIELGLDWESDSPIQFGTYITQRLGMKLKEWLDEQIAIGDGTTEPTGIFTASGVNTANSANGTNGPFAVGDFEAMSFGITKAMRSANPANCVYVTSDYMYRQARSTPVGSADARRVLGMNHSAYELMEAPCKIQDSISNGSIAYCNLAFYRMFRRLGIQVRNVVEGQTLALKNTRVIVVRARYGGQPTLGASICKMTDGPTSYGN